MIELDFDKRCGELESFRLFNVEIGKNRRGHTLWLWQEIKAKRKRGHTKAVQSKDHAIPLCRVGRPGSEDRITAYAEFYAAQMAAGTEESPFTKEQ